MSDWPTLSEQKEYWETQQLTQATMQAMSRTLDNLTHAVEGLLTICKDQQQQIENLEKQIKCQ